MDHWNHSEEKSTELRLRTMWFRMKVGTTVFRGLCISPEVPQKDGCSSRPKVFSVLLGFIIRANMSGLSRATHALYLKPFHFYPLAFLPDKALLMLLPPIPSVYSLGGGKHFGSCFSFLSIAVVNAMT